MSLFCKHNGSNFEFTFSHGAQVELQPSVHSLFLEREACVDMAEFTFLQFGGSRDEAEKAVDYMCKFYDGLLRVK
jgi:hypothetical protein